MLALALQISACATGYQETYIYEEIAVVNNSAQRVRDVVVRDTGSGRVFNCGDIGPFGTCSNRVGKRRYERAAIEVSWTFGSAARRTEAFVIRVPATFYTSLALRGVLAIAPGGSISAYFEQNSRKTRSFDEYLVASLVDAPGCNAHSRSDNRIPTPMRSMCAS